MYQTTEEGEQAFKLLYTRIRDKIYTLNQYVIDNTKLINSKGVIDIGNSVSVVIFNTISENKEYYKRIGLDILYAVVDKKGNVVFKNRSNIPSLRDNTFLFVMVGSIRYNHMIPMIYWISAKRLRSVILIDFSKYTLFDMDPSIQESVNAAIISASSHLIPFQTDIIIARPDVNLQAQEELLKQDQLISTPGMCQLWTCSILLLFIRSIRKSKQSRQVLGHFKSYLAKYIGNYRKGIDIRIQNHITVFTFFENILDEVLKRERIKVIPYGTDLPVDTPKGMLRNHLS